MDREVDLFNRQEASINCELSESCELVLGIIVPWKLAMQIAHDVLSVLDIDITMGYVSTI